MPAVFVHGNPETAAIWDPLRDALDRSDVVTLSPPGFGAPVRNGWTATRAEYVQWLAAEVDALDGPIDLVGHDWGAGHVVGFLLERPDAVRTWCVDALGIFHPNYEWHETAQIWQTPGAGEENVAGLVQTPTADLAVLFASLGMTTEVATAVAAGVNETMGECVLGLYRDAAQPALAELSEGLERLAARPGLAINAEHDHYVGTDAMVQEAAERAGASVHALSGVGHWWMCQDPRAGADALEQFWSEAAR